MHTRGGTSHRASTSGAEKQIASAFLRPRRIPPEQHVGGSDALTECGRLMGSPDWYGTAITAGLDDMVGGQQPPDCDSGRHSA